MNRLQLIKPLCLIVLLCTVFFNNSSADTKSDIQIEQFWVVSPPPVANSTAAYGIIKNISDEDDTLIRICSPTASVMLHKTEIESGMARMIHMTNTVIAAHSELVLEPMSYHLMFMNITPTKFSEGEEILLRFEFEKAGVIEVMAPVKSNW